MNIFLWIRDGVRQSILQGVSDAVDCLGTPSDEDDIRPVLLGLLRQQASQPPTLPSSGDKRRKLGRSLMDIQASAQKAG